ncbi:helix-turn-helix transcriptional regulator [Microbacterium sp. MPKO10]|uniref:helix-turn-helix domain-containing protein n=1 Tax=Microbacterium sp. MPKO10 TaxID=2989818 RepID=UPI0022366096|nr:helix-turn-helix transcriptional regulator [Microbacterium sp. MPKO10]MCW4458154.1 helix-turn-helix domain-containing protein [Microbacterium sp. MPKO10]
MATDHITAEQADKVAAAVERAGMSRTKLADLTGIPYTTLGRKINGHTSFTAVEIYDIAIALNTAPAALMPQVLLSTARSAA